MNVILADEGTIKMDEAANKILLTLHRGEFLKPNYKKLDEIPRLGVFNETTFEISLSQKKRESSAKYMTVFQLCRSNREINKELAKNVKVPLDSKKTKDMLIKQLSAYRQELSNLSRKRDDLTMELKRSNENLARQKSKIEGLENEGRIAKNYILVANENLIQVKRETKAGTLMGEDRDKKIMQIKETIEREKQRIYGIERKVATARVVQGDETKKIASLSQSISEINSQRDILLKKIGAIEDEAHITDKEKIKRKNDISIHKRLSQALSCITFVIIGVPLGIMLRSGHLIIGFGASFLVILFLYYPLVVTGIVMAENAVVPVVPALWGADIVMFIGGVFVFRKLFAR
jgi:lipopolysaccharide export LptBFGC system permease protein LptF